MEEGLHIGEVARLFGVSPATLRYWQSEGLLPCSREENGYRQYTLETLISLSNILYYRSLNLPIKKIREMAQQSPEILEVLLDESEQELERRILLLQKAKKKTRLRRQAIQLADSLRCTPYQKSMPPFSKIVHFTFSEPKKVKQYLAQPNRYVQIYSPEQPQAPLHGLAVPGSFREKRALWEAKIPDAQYRTCLLTVQEEKQWNNLTEHLEQVRQMGYTTGVVLAQYLFSAWEEEACDFYQAWIQVNP